MYNLHILVLFLGYTLFTQYVQQYMKYSGPKIQSPENLINSASNRDVYGLLNINK
jgi:hypothetical protein